MDLNRTSFSFVLQLLIQLNSTEKWGVDGGRVLQGALPWVCSSLGHSSAQGTMLGRRVTGGVKRRAGDQAPAVVSPGMRKSLLIYQKAGRGTRASEQPSEQGLGCLEQLCMGWRAHAAAWDEVGVMLHQGMGHQGYGEKEKPR